MDIKGLLLLSLVLVWSGPTVEGKAKKCKRPTGYPGDFAKCSLKGKWERDETLENIDDTVVENGRKLDKLLQSEGADQDCSMVIYGNSYNQDGDNHPDDAFIPYHVVTNEEDFWAGPNSEPDVTNYWITDNKKTGDEAKFDVVFSCVRNIKGFLVKNTNNNKFNDRGTKDFTISMSTSITGPWTKILTGRLPDAADVSPVPVLNFKLEDPVETSFLRFQIDSYYGLGGGLQYFSTY